MRWLLLSFLLWLPAVAAPLEWSQKPKLGWVHRLGVSLAVTGPQKVSCDADGALHVETDDYLMQIFAYADEAVARRKVSALAAESEAEKTFSGLKFGRAEKYPQPQGGSAMIQKGSVGKFRFILARLSKAKYQVVVYSITTSAEAEEATLELMSHLRFPVR